MTLQLSAAALTDRGLVRGTNQDAMHVGPWLLAVADGMGGMAAGDLASTIVRAAVAARDVPTGEESLVDALQAAVREATEGIRAAVIEDPRRQGMGSTLTALLLARTGTRLGLAHIGDSRAYLLRDRTLSQLTRDDTLVQRLLDEGLITEAEARTHPRRSVVTRAVQGQPVQPTCTVLTAQAGDRWLLCSDGLTNVVGAGQIAEVLRSAPDPAVCARRLVDLALGGGGPDNVTVVVADVVPTDAPVADPGQCADGADGL
jgi:serine/threonine protein phosphatase PrpC